MKNRTDDSNQDLIVQNRGSIAKNVGPIIADIDGYELSPEDQDFLSHPLIGGIILFSRNYCNPDQLTVLIKQIKSLQRHTPLLVSVDQEGGRVQRFREHFTVLPAMSKLGEMYDVDPNKAIESAFLIGWLLAAELRQYDVDYSYTPVLDLDYQVSEVIGSRAFHADPKAVFLLAKALIDGLHAVGMPVTGKHFPGHGAVSVDSHIALPIDTRPLATISTSDLLPYAELMKQNYLNSIMTAHIVYSDIDPRPVCFSPFWIQTVLRKQLGFNGVIVSDDLTMEGAAVAGDFGDRAYTALEAGCDMILICNHRKGARMAVDRLEQHYVGDEARDVRCQQLYAKSLPDNFNQHPNWEIARSVIQKMI